MIQFTTSKGEYVLVEVPKDAHDFEWVTNQSEIPYKPALQYFTKCKVTGYPQGETIDIGFPFTCLCTTDDITEEVAASIVDEEQGEQIYFDYNRKSYVLLSGKFSFITLLQSLNLSPNKNYAICKKN